MPCPRVFYFCLTRNKSARCSEYCNLVISSHPWIETMRRIIGELSLCKKDITLSSISHTMMRIPEQRAERLSDFYFPENVSEIRPTCDFSLASVLHHVSPMLLMRIIVSILAHRTVVIFSLSPVLASYVVASIHALLYPFHMEHVDVEHCFCPESLNAAMLNSFVNSSDEKSKVLRRPLLMSLRSDLAKLLILKREKNATMQTSVFDVEEVENSISLSVSSHQNAIRSKRSVALREKDAINMRAMEENVPANGEAIFQHAYFFDLDSEMVWYENSWVESSSCGWSVPELTPSAQLEFLVSIKKCLDRCHSHEKCCGIFPSCEALSECNESIQQCFHRLWFLTILRGIPPALVHYPKQKVIGVNADALMLLFHSLGDAQQADNTNSVHIRCHVEFIMALLDSPIFLDLLKRHGNVLNPFV